MPRSLRSNHGYAHQVLLRFQMGARKLAAAVAAMVSFTASPAHGQQPIAIPPIPIYAPVASAAAREMSPTTPSGTATAQAPPISIPTAKGPINGTIVVPAQAPLPAPQPSTTPAPTLPAQGAPQATPENPYSGPLSNPLLSPFPPTLGVAPVTSQATREKVHQYVQKLLDPETTLDLVTGQTRVLVLKQTPFRVQAGDERVLSLSLANPREVLLQGKAVGATVLNLWFGDKDDPAKQSTLTYLIQVYPDPQAKARMELAYRKLQDDINAYFKDTSIKLSLIGDKVVVSGRVRDYIQGQQVLQMIKANMGGNQGNNNNTGTGRQQPGGPAAQVPIPPPGGNVIDPAVSDLSTPTLESFQSMGGPNVINLLEVAGEQQVSLRVVVAEVNRAAARSIGMNFSITNNRGVTVFANNTGPIIPFSNSVGSSAGSAELSGFGTDSLSSFTSGAVSNLTAVFNAGKVPFAINALRTMQYARSLAEPTLVTLNGQTANFLAGGQFPVPVVSGTTFTGLQGVQYIPYGVQLSFTPFITDRDRIRMVLNINVSSRDISSGTSIGGSSVVGLTMRSVNNTVELRHGETLAVAGLIESNSGSDSTRIPFLGTLPLIGQLTGLTRHQAGEKELVIFITPELARPIDPEQVIKLPGYEILDPNDLEFYVWGRIEGHCKDYRSPVRTDLGRIRQYQQIEQVNVAGPTGYTPAP